MNITLPGSPSLPGPATQAVFQVPTMTCGACVRRVKAALLRVDGVSDVRARFDLRQVTVTRDAELAPDDDLRAALREAGYPAAEG